MTPPEQPPHSVQRHQYWYTSFYRRTFLLVTATILGLGVYEVLKELLGAIGWAAVLAFILFPLHESLTRRFKGRAGWSAGLLTGLTPFVVLAPLSILGVAFAGQVASLIAYLRNTTFLPYPQMINKVENYPVIGASVHWLRQNAPVSVDQVQGWLTEGAQTVLKSAAALGGNLALVLFGTVVSFFMMLFLLFFFLKDGRLMLKRLTPLVPLEPVRRERLLNYLADVTRAVVFGSTATALIQGIFVGVGFWIAGLPSPLVFAVLGTIAAFLPAGAGMVLIPAALYLLAMGRWGAAIFMVFWTAAMWVVENVLRPLLTAQQAEVSTLAIFVGAIGGASAFGVLGLFIGPILLSFVVALIQFSEANKTAQ